MVLTWTPSLQGAPQRPTYAWNLSPRDWDCKDTWGSSLLFAFRLADNYIVLYLHQDLRDNKAPFDHRTDLPG